MGVVVPVVVAGQNIVPRGVWDKRGPTLRVAMVVAMMVAMVVPSAAPLGESQRHCVAGVGDDGGTPW